MDAPQDRTPMRTRRFDLVSLAAVAAGTVAGHVLVVAPLVKRLTLESRVAISCTVEAVPRGVGCAHVADAADVMRAEPAEPRIAAPFRAYALPGDRLRGVFEGRARFTPEGLLVSAYEWSLVSAAGDVRVRSVRLVLGAHDRPDGRIGPELASSHATPTPKLRLRDGERYAARDGLDLLLPGVNPRDLTRGDLAIAVALETPDGEPLPDAILRAEPTLTAALLDRAARARAAAYGRAVREEGLRRRGAPHRGR